MDFDTTLISVPNYCLHPLPLAIKNSSKAKLMLRLCLRLWCRHFLMLR